MIVTLDQGWSPKCLSEVGSDDDWAVIKTSSVQKVNFVKDENKKLPASFDARPELSLKKGDVLITRAGPRVRCGVTCLVTKDHPKLMICDKVYRIRTDSEVLMPEYLNFLFNSPQYLEVIEELKTGSSESGMNMTMKKLVEIILLTPSVVEQLEIIKLVEKLFTYADQIEQRVKDAQARVNHLTQSILAKAFRGELTADWRAENPELISGENSAAALLGRIKAERDKVSVKRKRVK
jgi:type I restriction enzyme S subunit